VGAAKVQKTIRAVTIMLCLVQLGRQMVWRGVIAVILGMLGNSQSFAADSPLALPHRPAAEVRAEQAEYDARHLEIRQITTQYSVGYMGYGAWPGFGWPIYRHGGFREAYWTVYKGQQSLESTTFYDLVDRPELSDEVLGRIAKNRTASTVLYATGAAGMLGLLVGAHQMDTATTTDQYTRGATLFTGGAGLFVGGILGAGIPQLRARELRFQVGRTMPYEEAAAAVFTYNEQLRKEIGMGPDKVRSVDSWAPGTPK
jgi:hypothetical protein